MLASVAVTVATWTAIAVSAGSVARAATAPDWAYSYYITANCQTPSHFTSLGKNLAGAVDAGTKPKDAMAILHFFRPEQFADGSWGTSCSTGPDTKIADITTDAKKFGLGYYNNINTSGATLKIAVGTSNQFISSWGTTKLTNHGKAWAGMINNLNTWVAGGYSGRISYAGASDMELDWASPSYTRAWVNGFGATINNWNLFDYGDAAGCKSTSGGSSSDCGTPTYPGWDSEDVWYISWGTGWSNPGPQIYRSDGVNADQWYWLTKYGVVNHPARGKMNFVTALSEKAACGCTNENGPTEAWTQLYNRINGDSAIADDIRWSSNIKWD